MIKADAIYYLTWLKDEAIDDADSHRCEALDMAINALKNERPKGHWIEVDGYESEKHSVTDMRCNLCRKYASVVLPHGTRYVYDFCPNCGADMRQNLFGKHADVTIIDEAPAWPEPRRQDERSRL